MRRPLNVRFLLGLLGGGAVLTLACHSVHALQVRRNAAALLAQAVRSEEQGQHGQAAAYLGNYLAFVPEDTDGLARYGLLLDRLAYSAPARRRAFGVLEQVLRREPERH